MRCIEREFTPHPSHSPCLGHMALPLPLELVGKQATNSIIIFYAIYYLCRVVMSVCPEIMHRLLRLVSPLISLRVSSPPPPYHASLPCSFYPIVVMCWACLIAELRDAGTFNMSLVLDTLDLCLANLIALLSIRRNHINCDY